MTARKRADANAAILETLRTHSGKIPRVESVVAPIHNEKRLSNTGGTLLAALSYAKFQRKDVIPRFENTDSRLRIRQLLQHS